MPQQTAGLNVLPHLDSPTWLLAARRSWTSRVQLLRSLEGGQSRHPDNGSYLNEAGERVDWSREVEAACAAKRSIPPDAELPASEVGPFSETRVQVANETTLGAAFRLHEDGHRPLALNFANGVHPGGGFLNGARAQEEVLCRSSALYKTLVGDPMYGAHRKRGRPDSTDWVIYSPDAPVFRRDEGTALDRHWLLSFITCAAPYAPAIGQPESGDREQARRLVH